MILRYYTTAAARFRFTLASYTSRNFAHKPSHNTSRAADANNRPISGSGPAKPA